MAANERSLITEEVQGVLCGDIVPRPCSSPLNFFLVSHPTAFPRASRSTEGWHSRPRRWGLLRDGAVWGPFRAFAVDQLAPSQPPSLPPHHHRAAIDGSFPEPWSPRPVPSLFIFGVRPAVRTITRPSRRPYRPLDVGVNHPSRRPGSCNSETCFPDYRSSTQTPLIWLTSRQAPASPFQP
ncbi:hypothetical protein VTI74DRAFT_398 [Chaetomium olivicolor]